MDDLKFNDCIESKFGTWEYFKDANTGQIELLYFRDMDDSAHIRIPITGAEFEDLRTLFSAVDESLHPEVNDRYLVWWVDQNDAEQARHLVSSLVDARYIVPEFDSLDGRNGRGRLWVPEGIPIKEMNFDETSPVARYCSNAAGIVFREEDYVHLQDFPGKITDLNLKSYRRYKTIL